MPSANVCFRICVVRFVSLDYGRRKENKLQENKKMHLLQVSRFPFQLRERIKNKQLCDGRRRCSNQVPPSDVGGKIEDIKSLTPFAFRI